MSLDQLRADFALVWRTWRDRGEITQAEHDEGRHEGAAAIREHMSDLGWMACCCAHYRQMAGDMELDRERSVRIAAEVRAEKEAEQNIGKQRERARRDARMAA